MTKAAITPGTQPQSHNKKTITMEPQPLSITAKGGQKIESKTLQILMMIYFLMIDVAIGRINRLIVTTSIQWVNVFHFKINYVRFVT